MLLHTIKEKKIIIGLVIICLTMIVISYKQIFNLFDTTVNDILKSKFNSTEYLHINSVAFSNPEIKIDEAGNLFYNLSKNVETNNVVNISCRSGFSENECPLITFTYFKNLPGEIILKREIDGKFVEANYTIINFSEHTFQKMFVVENDISYNLRSIQFLLDFLPAGNYRISDKSNSSVDKYLSFQIYSEIPVVWNFNKERLQSLDPLSFLVEPDMDTRWYYINDILNDLPLLEFHYKIYKDGNWSQEKILNFSNSEIYFTNKICKNKSKFFFRTVNPLKEWIELRLISDSVGVDEFVHGEEFSKSYYEEFGDSISFKFGMSIEPMQWSRYNYQYIFSDYYTMPSEYIYENFLDKSE